MSKGFYSGKRCTVTGASGLIGSYVVKVLKQEGAIVRAICHKREANELTKLADEVFWLDLHHPECALDAVDNTEVVFSCAGITGGIGLTEIDAVSYVGPATGMVINTLHACVQKKVERFGYLSSTTVYAPSDRPVVEADSELPAKLYDAYRGIGESKRFLEKLCTYYNEKTDLKTCSVRPSGAYGRFDNFDEKTSHVLPGMVNRALALEEGKFFEIWGDGQDVRDLIHAEDVARCLLIATSKVETSAYPVNAASGLSVTTFELARKILILAGKGDSQIITNKNKPSALRSRLVNIDRALELGFESMISLSAGIEDVINWRKGLL